MQRAAARVIMQIIRSRVKDREKPPPAVNFPSFLHVEGNFGVVSEREREGGIEREKGKERDREIRGYNQRGENVRCERLRDDMRNGSQKCRFCRAAFSLATDLAFFSDVHALSFADRFSHVFPDNVKSASSGHDYEPVFMRSLRDNRLRHENDDVTRHRRIPEKREHLFYTRKISR